MAKNKKKRGQAKAEIDVKLVTMEKQRHEYDKRAADMTNTQIPKIQKQIDEFEEAIDKTTNLNDIDESIFLILQKQQKKEIMWVTKLKIAQTRRKGLELELEESKLRLKMRDDQLAHIETDLKDPVLDLTEKEKAELEKNKVQYTANKKLAEGVVEGITKILPYSDKTIKLLRDVAQEYQSQIRNERKIVKLDIQINVIEVRLETLDDEIRNNNSDVKLAKNDEEKKLAEEEGKDFLKNKDELKVNLDKLKKEKLKTIDTTGKEKNKIAGEEKSVWESEKTKAEILLEMRKKLVTLAKEAHFHKKIKYYEGKVKDREKELVVIKRVLDGMIVSQEMQIVRNRKRESEEKLDILEEKKARKIEDAELKVLKVKTKYDIQTKLVNKFQKKIDNAVNANKA